MPSRHSRAHQRRRRSSVYLETPPTASRRGSRASSRRESTAPGSRAGSRRESNAPSSRRGEDEGSVSDEQKTTSPSQRDSRTSSVHAPEQDLENLLSKYMKDRRKSRRSIKHRPSVEFSVSGESEDEGVLQMYEEGGEADGGKSSAEREEEIFENIQLQKEIIANVRNQPWSMAKKRQMLGLARQYVEKHEGHLSRSHGYQEKGAQVLRRLKRELANLQNIFVPWEMRIKEIESHFGSVVASYFVFLRWLVWINIWLTVIPVCFVILPEAMVGEDYGTPPRKAPPDSQKETMANLKTIWDAEGIVKYSPMFYGYYGNETAIGSGGYRLPLAYFVTGLASLAFSFLIILKKMAANSRMNRSSSKDEQFTFSWKLFTSWDFMIGNSETANNKVAAINIAFKESILEEEEKVKEGNKYFTYFLRILANFIVVCMLAASAYMIQLLVERSRVLEAKKMKDPTLKMTFWEEQELTLVMTLISTLFPNVVELIAVMEKYHPRVALRWMLTRIFVLNLINLYTLFIALYQKTLDMIDTEKQRLHCTENSTMATVATTLDPLSAFFNSSIDNITMATVSIAPSTTTDMHGVTACPPMANLEPQCWETMIGQELYKLTILDLVFVVGQIVLIDFIRGLCVKYLNVLCCWDLETNFPEYAEFKTAENILHLINNQGMIWLGAFFSPGLPALNMIKITVLMYVRCWACLVCNVPQDRIFRASRSNNFYYTLLLIMLFLCTLPIIFALTAIPPSRNCGPFSNFKTMSDVLTQTINDNFSKLTMDILNILTSAAVIIPVFLLLVLSIYYLISSNSSKSEINRDLKMQLEYERTDGRKKVYAMAGAKRELEEGGGDPEQTTALGKKMAAATGESQRTMASAVSSVMAASRMTKLLAVGSKAKTKHEPSQPPVAVVQGKQSIPSKNRPARRPQLADIARLKQEAERQRSSEDQSAESDSTGVLSTQKKIIQLLAKSSGRKDGTARHKHDGGDMSDESRAASLIQDSFRTRKAKHESNEDKAARLIKDILGKNVTAEKSDEGRAAKLIQENFRRKKAKQKSQAVNEKGGDKTDEGKAALLIQERFRKKKANSSKHDTYDKHRESRSTLSSDSKVSRARAEKVSNMKKKDKYDYTKRHKTNFLRVDDSQTSESDSDENFRLDELSKKHEDIMHSNPDLNEYKFDETGTLIDEDLPSRYTHSGQAIPKILVTDHSDDKTTLNSSEQAVAPGSNNESVEIAREYTIVDGASGSEKKSSLISKHDQEAKSRVDGIMENDNRIPPIEDRHDIPVDSSIESAKIEDDDEVGASNILRDRKSEDSVDVIPPSVDSVVAPVGVAVGDTSVDKPSDTVTDKNSKDITNNSEVHIEGELSDGPDNGTLTDDVNPSKTTNDNTSQTVVQIHKSPAKISETISSATKQLLVQEIKKKITRVPPTPREKPTTEVIEKARSQIAHVTPEVVLNPTQLKQQHIQQTATNVNDASISLGELISAQTPALGTHTTDEFKPPPPPEPDADYDVDEDVIIDIPDSVQAEKPKQKSFWGKIFKKK